MNDATICRHAIHCQHTSVIFVNENQNGEKRGVHTHGAITPKFELGRDFCAVHLLPKFHQPMFTGSEVTALTNKQRDAAENIQHSSLRYDIG